MIINNGPVGGGISKINPLIDIQYSYDNINWNYFIPDSNDSNKLIDQYNCAELNLLDGILTIKASSGNGTQFYYNDNTDENNEIIKDTYVDGYTYYYDGTNWQSYWNELKQTSDIKYMGPKQDDNQIWITNINKKFYLKILKNHKINYCLVGGGGGGSGSGMTGNGQSHKHCGGGGGAGGQVVFNDSPIKIKKGIYEIQIGIGGFSGGGGDGNYGNATARWNYFPRQGGPTILMNKNFMVIAQGGNPAAFQTNWHTERADVWTYHYYTNLNSGRAGGNNTSNLIENTDTTDDATPLGAGGHGGYLYNGSTYSNENNDNRRGQAGADGVLWEINNNFYGGGGAGGAGSYYYYNPQYAQSYSGVGRDSDGGQGGGGKSEKNGQNNTGGGAGGSSGPSTTYGGTGVCLIQFELK